MRRVIAMGEIVFDIIFKENTVLTSRAGGSVLNTSVSLAKLGLDVKLLSFLGNDKIGSFILSFLEEKGIDTSLMTVLSNNTSIAVAWLNENNNAEYTFYKNGNIPENLKVIPIFDNDIFLFGSTFSVQSSSKTSINKYIDALKKADGLIYYDPNIRLKDKSLEESKETIITYMQKADIVRASNEDITALTNLQNSADMLDFADSHNIKTFILTCGAKGVWLKTNAIKKFYTVPIITPLSTIGAGDTFNAGIIEGLKLKNIYKNNLHNVSIQIWDEIIAQSISYAAQVCLSFDNYLVS